MSEALNEALNEVFPEHLAWQLVEFPPREELIIDRTGLPPGRDGQSEIEAFQRAFFDLTGKIYLGPFVMCLIFIMILMSNTVSYFPI